jgi:hypothetical protein
MRTSVMLELAFLFYFLPRRMTRLARERHRSALAWSVAASAAWIVAEIVVVSAIVFAAFITAQLWGWPTDTESVTVVAYLPGLLAGLVAAEIVRHYLLSRPVITEESKSRK